MNAQVYRIVVRTAGFLLASVGFFLSVLSVIFNLLDLVPAVNQAPQFIASERHTRRLHVPIEKAMKGQAPPPPKAPNVKKPDELVAQATGPDYTPPPPHHIPHTEDTLSRGIKRKPTVITFVQNTNASGHSTLPTTIPHSTPSERILVHSDCEEPSRSFLSQFKTLGDKRPKLQHHVSSPHLASPHLTSRPPLPVPAPEASSVKRKKSRPFGKEQGSPPPMPSRSVSCPLVKRKSMEKKKSQTLRTQPYEAPYFFPPPVPPIPSIPPPKRMPTRRSDS